MTIELCNQLLSEFGSSIGLDELRLDATGYCCLRFDALEVRLQFDAADDSLVAFSQLGQLDGDAKAEACELMLGANLFWSGTGGATLALEVSDTVVYIATSTRATLDYPGFEEWLGSFVAAADHWAGVVGRINGGEEDPDEGEEDRAPSAARPTVPHFV
jgi:Tir chaperone protein (CesT) family